jgi:hypothetical protein
MAVDNELPCIFVYVMQWYTRRVFHIDGLAKKYTRIMHSMQGVHSSKLRFSMVFRWLAISAFNGLPEPRHGAHRSNDCERPEAC